MSSIIKGVSVTFDHHEIIKEVRKHTDSDTLINGMEEKDFNRLVEDIYYCKFFGLPKDGKFPSESKSCG